ncbi:hypothetical protein [Mycobacteroides abscessus]|uniref:hypothetical protein n=1 Tax=Mycobacteroides abscessus TaxID=36809 RepID=UPI001041E82E|nr:hypothetical protein [Mycobacteroides abscessus]QSN49765.1 hypothetical protein I3U33_26920 [Mycobacteroides abscessus subsp. abscessus]
MSVDAQRFALVASVLRPARSELLQVSDGDLADKGALVQAAAVMDWLIARADGCSAIFSDLDEQGAAMLRDEPLPQQTHAQKVQQEMKDFPRPAMPASFLTFYDLPVTRAALRNLSRFCGGRKYRRVMLPPTASVICVRACDAC